MDQVETVSDLTSLDRSLQRAIGVEGPHLIVADVEADEMADLGKYPAMPFDIVESAIRFRRNSLFSMNWLLLSKRSWNAYLHTICLLWMSKRS